MTCMTISLVQSLSQELSSESGKLVARRCDVRQEQEVKEVFQFARAQFGGVDVCVNNAGLAHWAPILTGSTEEWREMLEVSHTRQILSLHSVVGHKVSIRSCILPRSMPSR